MKISANKQKITDFKGDCVVIFRHKITKNDELITKRLKLFDFELGKILMLDEASGFQAKRLIVVGLGEDDLDAKNYQKALLSLVAKLDETGIKTAILECVKIAGFDENWVVATTARLIKDAIYRVEKIALKANPLVKIAEINIATNADKAVLNGEATADGMALTRFLGDLPPNICTPTFMANYATDMAKKYGLECEILEQDDLEKLAMGALLSVSKGSIEPPKFIILHYKAAGNTKPIVLVGKGVTFDSGGISLKSSPKMDEMKFDMCGAAAAFGAMLAVAKIKPKINLTVVVPAVENMPDAIAAKPGDVVKSMSGQTIEILSTDAEGRMILCDALTYVERFDPAVVIDLATLTGAVIAALGGHRSGLMGNNQDLIDDLIAASKTSLDGTWQLPIDDEYNDQLKSNFADIANTGGSKAGSITAGCFLARFTKAYPWAHLDIAGVAWLEGSKKGATARPVPLLVQYLLNHKSK